MKVFLGAALTFNGLFGCAIPAAGCSMSSIVWPAKNKQEVFELLLVQILEYQYSLYQYAICLH